MVLFGSKIHEQTMFEVKAMGQKQLTLLDLGVGDESGRPKHVAHAAGYAPVEHVYNGNTYYVVHDLYATVCGHAFLFQQTNLLMCSNIQQFEKINKKLLGSFKQLLGLPAVVLGLPVGARYHGMNAEGC